MEWTERVILDNPGLWGTILQGTSRDVNSFVEQVLNSPASASSSQPPNRQRTLSPPHHRASWRFLCASVLFFLSGATGLAYEVVWFKRFSHVWGSSSLALAAVVASFLGGLGLGAWVFGRAADRWRSPLQAYGIFEVAIGLLALLVPVETRALLEATSSLHAGLQSSPLALSLARCALTFLVLGPPCILMGGTLPLLVSAVSPRASAVKESVGWLYAVNALGAAAGCAATGFWLLPALGLQATNLVAAAASVTVGVLAVLLARGWKAKQAPASDAPAPSIDVKGSERLLPRTPRLAAIFAAALLTGCAALMLQVAWTRQLALILGGSTYAFSAMLCTFIAGIGLGSLVYHILLSRQAIPLATAPIVIAGVAVTVLLGKLLIPTLTILLGQLSHHRNSALADGVVCVAASAVLELLPAMGMGLLFPLLLELAARQAGHAGSTVGAIYALNTLGSIAGATAGVLLLMPWLGVSWTIASAVLLYATALVLCFPAISRWREQALLLGLMTVAIGAALFAAQAEDPRVTSIGMYLYGVPDPAAEQPEVLYFRDGASASVLVLDHGGVVSLRVNGKVDASNVGDMPMQLGSAYFPLFLTPGAEEALVIGYGSGTTSGTLLLKPDLRVTCAEIEPAVVEGAEHFSAVNHKPREQEPARFSIVHDDGRSFLQSTQKRHDLIISEPSNPWMAGVSNLFTREFYEIARERLAPGGVLAQWVQGYAFTVAEYALVVRTLLSVFPEAMLVRILDGDTIILAANKPIVVDSSLCARAQSLVDASSAMRADLDLHFGSTDVRSLLFRHVILDRQGLLRLTAAAGPGPINTDINLRLEFDAPRRLFLRPERLRSVPTGIIAAVEIQYFENLARKMGSPRELASAAHELAVLLAAKSRRDVARDLARLGLKLDPGHVDLLLDHVVQADPGDLPAFDAALAALVEAARDQALTSLGLAGSRLYKDGQDALAARVFERIIVLEPGSATAWANLGNARAALGDLEEAAQALQKAAALDPLNDFVHKSLETLRKGEPKAKPGG